jgi:hypothetical protein
LIRTEQGKTIMIQHNETSPRPYNRLYRLTGTKGFANKYPISGYALVSENIDGEITKNHENLNTHDFVPRDVKEALMKKIQTSDC